MNPNSHHNLATSKSDYTLPSISKYEPLSHSSSISTSDISLLDSSPIPSPIIKYSSHQSHHHPPFNHSHDIETRSRFSANSNSLSVPQTFKKRNRNSLPQPSSNHGSEEDLGILPKHKMNYTPPATPSDSMASSFKETLVRKAMKITATENLFIIRNDSLNCDPLVLEKKNGHFGCFIPYDEKVHLGLESAPKETPNITMVHAHIIVGIITIDANESFLVLVGEHQKVGRLMGKKMIYRIQSLIFLSFKPNSIWTPTNKEYPPYFSVEKFLASELFYYALNYPLTLSLQKQSTMMEIINQKPAWKVADRRFYWNYYLQRHFIKQRLSAWIVPIIRGFVGVEYQKLPETGDKLTIAVLSRISCRRAGTRYYSRGINDDGNVANFVESEQILMIKKNTFSFLQTRGSVPVFWQQRFVQTGYKVELHRTREASAPAFKQHFDDMLKNYKRVHIVNLLAAKLRKEMLLCEEYSQHLVQYLKNLPNSYLVVYTHWDFNQECGLAKLENSSRILDHEQIKNNLDDLRFFWRDKDNTVLQTQNGVFRVNCLDCLDRTNVIISVLARASIPIQLKSIGIDNVKITNTNSFGQAFQNLWANNGDYLSRAYAGTGAMKSNFTRVGETSVFSLVDDFTKSAKRTFINYYKDSDRQDAIDLFLGNMEEQIADESQSDEIRWITHQLVKRQSEYAEVSPMQIYVGSWNTNGTFPPKGLSLEQWISPEYPNRKDLDHDKIGIYIFGFQEIVELNANNIVKTDYHFPDSPLDTWSKALRDEINNRRKVNKVILVHSDQLVGIALLIFVQENYAGYFRNFTIEKTKTAVQGLAGNKGALICHFDFKDTSICCVCAHLTAGQKKIQERSKDIEEIMNTRFLNIRHTPTIQSHDYIFWFGDLNFRINLGYNDAIGRTSREDYDQLFYNDQLRKAMHSGILFRGYKEGTLDFPPTYKYDVGNDTFDTSEKKRVPAWCDRILYKSQSQRIEQLVYSRGELYVSDHRPVKSLFEIDIKTVDVNKKEKVEQELYKILRGNKLPELDVIAPDSNPNQPELQPQPQPQPPQPTVKDIIISPETNNFVPPSYIVPPPDNKTQKDIKLFNATLIAIKSKVEASFNQEDSASIIMGSANIAASTIKSLLVFLESFDPDNVVNSLMAELLEKYKLIETTAKQAFANLDDKVAHNDFTDAIKQTIDVINEHVPYVK